MHLGEEMSVWDAGDKRWEIYSIKGKVYMQMSFATGHCSKVIFRQLNATTHYFFHVFFAKCRYVSRCGNEKEEKEQMFVGI